MRGKGRVCLEHEVTGQHSGLQGLMGTQLTGLLRTVVLLLAVAELFTLH